MRALAWLPHVVAPAFNDIDLFPGAFAHVTQPQLTGVAIEAPAPGIAQAPGIDFRCTATAGEGIVARYRVVLARRRNAVDVDTQHCAQQGIDVLPVVLRIVARAAVAEAEKQFSEAGDGDMPAVVLGD